MKKTSTFETGYVQVYTGNGKGKTTAAFGLAMRAAGAGLPVFIGQFIKSGKYSEIAALERFNDLITCRQYGKGRFIRGKPSEEDVRLAREGWDEIRNLVRNNSHRLVILDEINVALTCGLVPLDELLKLIQEKPKEMELLLTGRKADPKLIEQADLVTEMREVKHYFKQGVPARKGIEQ